MVPARCFIIVNSIYSYRLKEKIIRSARYSLSLLLLLLPFLCSFVSSKMSQSTNVNQLTVYFTSLSSSPPIRLPSSNMLSASFTLPTGSLLHLGKCSVDSSFFVRMWDNVSDSSPLFKEWSLRMRILLCFRQRTTAPQGRSGDYQRTLGWVMDGVWGCGELERRI